MARIAGLRAFWADWHLWKLSSEQKRRAQARRGRQPQLRRGVQLWHRAEAPAGARAATAAHARAQGRQEPTGDRLCVTTPRVTKLSLF